MKHKCNVCGKEVDFWVVMSWELAKDAGTCFDCRKEIKTQNDKIKRDVEEECKPK